MSRDGVQRREGPAQVWRWVPDRLRRRAMRRGAVPSADRTWAPALAWAALAIGLVVGGLLPDRGPAVVALTLVAFASTRPDRRRLLWLAVAASVVCGGVRVQSIDRAAASLPEGPVAAAAVTLNASLAASSRDHGSTAAAEYRGHRVVIAAPRFGKPSAAMPRGAIVTVTGHIVALGDQGNDARLRRAGVAGRVLAEEIHASGTGRGGVRGAIDRFATTAQATIVGGVGTRRGALLAGMALGTADGIGEADRDALRTSGLWHLVAASGGNIALVVGLVMVLGWAVGVPDRWRLLVAATAVCAYVPLAGAGPSIQRAGVMGLAGLAALALRREHRRIDALAMAAVLTLALNPRDYLDVGWQLSFAASAALMFAGPRVAHALTDLGLPNWLAVGLACTIVATVATAPITLLVFGQLSIIGLLANALALPLVGVAVWSGAGAAVLAPISPQVAEWCAQPGGVAAGLMLHIADWSASRSFATVGAATAAGLALTILAVWVVRPPRVTVAALAAGALLVLAWSVPAAPAEPRLVVLDIGQGSAALLQDGAEGVLVDAGPQDGGVVAALRSAGVRRLAAVVLSHPAADHDGGAAAVLAAFPTDLLLDGGEPGGGPTHDAAIAAAHRRGVRVVPVRAGQTLTVGAITVRIRWPTPAATLLPGDPNDRAAVVQATVGQLTALVPADAEGNVLQKLGGLSAEVLVVSHHGSADPDLPTVLGHLQPKLAVVSVGAHNTYGHPAAPTLAALTGAHVPTLRTDQSGSVDIRADASGRVVVRRER